MIIVYYLYYKARFKRRISHVPNLTRELNAYEVRRLNQLNSTAKIKCDVCRIWDWNSRRFDFWFKRRISHVPNLMRKF